MPTSNLLRPPEPPRQQKIKELELRQRRIKLILLAGYFGGMFLVFVYIYRFLTR
jgi:hypothetical protein